MIVPLGFDFSPHSPHSQGHILNLFLLLMHRTNLPRPLRDLSLPPLPPSLPRPRFTPFQRRPAAPSRPPCSPTQITLFPRPPKLPQPSLRPHLQFHKHIRCPDRRRTRPPPSTLLPLPPRLHHLPLQIPAPIQLALIHRIRERIGEGEV